jgi:AraC-like DNA-binding protein
MVMSFNTYELLVDNFGEAVAFDLCEKLGGVQLKIPKKAHKGYRARKLITRALQLIQKEESKRHKLVKAIQKYLGIDESHVYRIIREIEDDNRKKKN